MTVKAICYCWQEITLHKVMHLFILHTFYILYNKKIIYYFWNGFPNLYLISTRLWIPHQWPFLLYISSDREHKGWGALKSYGFETLTLTSTARRLIKMCCTSWKCCNYKCPTTSLTSLSWSSTLAIGTRETWPAGWALLTRRTWGASPTWLTGRSSNCSDWKWWLDGDLVQYWVIARQVACKEESFKRWRFKNVFFVIFYHK